MKLTVWWRLSLILFLLGMWFYSLFPMQDRDYFDTFETMAASHLVTIEQDAARAKAAGNQSAATEATGKLEQFRRITKEARAAVKAKPELAPMLALKQAAKGAEGSAHVKLSDYIHVPGQGRASNDLVLSFVRRKASGQFRFGLDISGGTEFIIGFDPAKVPSDRRVEEVRDQILEILRNRVDRLGVAEPEIKPVGPSSISLRMPSVTENDKAGIRDMIINTAKLEFHLVHQESDRLVAEHRQNPDGVREPGYVYVEMEVERNGEITTEGLFIKARPERVRGEDVKSAMATFNEFGSYSVSLSFNGKGAAAFAQVTTENVNRRLAIVLDKKVYSAPNIREPITGGNAEISGNFSPEESQQLSVVLQCGRLPVNISIDSEFGTDPTLGREQVRSGIQAGLWGALFVVVFMLVYYRVAGVIAIVALGANLLLTVGTMTLTQATFTLPGLAGIALGIGMGVDSNILIFERIREETAAGKNLPTAVDAGFNRAFLTIFDSNLTTLLTAMILFYCGTSSIRGFAVTLSIGIVANMLTAVTFSKVLFDLLLRFTDIKKLSMMSVVPQPNWNYFKFKWVAVALSILFILITIVTAAVRGRDCLSIDFTGGTAITYKYGTDAPPPTAAVSDAFAKGGYKDARVGYKFTGAQKEHLLEIVVSGSKDNEVDPDAATKLLVKSFPTAKFEQMQTTTVGGLVGHKFQTYAILAVVFSWLAIILYVAFRFEFAYGVASVIALMHDVLIATGVCLIFGRQLSLPVLAALLTIIGFSINDTIVIFDRIREQFSLERRGSYLDLVNLSVSQCMARTVLTTLTVFISVLSLFLFGGGAVNDFALVLLGGIISGTYSTVFIASAIIVYWHKKRPIHEETKLRSAAAVAGETEGDVPA